MPSMTSLLPDPAFESDGHLGKHSIRRSRVGGNPVKSMHWIRVGAPSRRDAIGAKHRLETSLLHVKTFGQIQTSSGRINNDGAPHSPAVLNRGRVEHKIIGIRSHHTFGLFGQ